MISASMRKREFQKAMLLMGVLLLSGSYGAVSVYGQQDPQVMASLSTRSAQVNDEISMTIK